MVKFIHDAVAVGPKHRAAANLIGVADEHRTLSNLQLPVWRRIHLVHELVNTLTKEETK